MPSEPTAGDVSARNWLSDICDFKIAALPAEQSEDRRLREEIRRYLKFEGGRGDLTNPLAWSDLRSSLKAETISEALLSKVWIGEGLLDTEKTWIVEFSNKNQYGISYCLTVYIQYIDSRQLYMYIYALNPIHILCICFNEFRLRSVEPRACIEGWPQLPPTWLSAVVSRTTMRAIFLPVILFVLLAMVYPCTHPCKFFSHVRGGLTRHQTQCPIFRTAQALRIEQRRAHKAGPEEQPVSNLEDRKERIEARSSAVRFSVSFIVHNNNSSNRSPRPVEVTPFLVVAPMLFLPLHCYLSSPFLKVLY